MINYLGKYIIIIICFISTLFSFAQTNVDSLIKEASRTDIHDSVKIKLYGDISWEILGSDINKALYYANKELELAIKAKRKADIAQAESDIGNIYNRKSLYDTAIVHYYKALELRKELKQDIKIAGIYTNIASALMRQSKLQESLDYNFKALKIFEKVEDKPKQALLLGNIGNIYHELNQIKSAEKFFLQSLVLAREFKQPLTLGNVLTNLGTLKYNKKEYDTSLVLFLDAEKVFIEVNAQYNLGGVYNNIGRLYMQKNELNKASQYYEKGLKTRELIEDKLGIGLSNQALGDIECKKGNFTKALLYYEKCEKIFLELKNYLGLSTIYNNMSACFEEKNDYLSSLKYFKLFSNYKDSIFNESNASMMNEMQSKYESEKKDLELAKNKAEMESDKNQRYVTYSILALFVFLFAATIWAFIQKRKNNAVLEQKNSLLENANHEISHQKEILSEKQKEILDSIHYARRIQQALLAHKEFIDENIPESFIYFNPKDIVSGDFYWATKRDHFFFLAVCDSTGHGVPGAFMSLLNIGFLSEAINEKDIFEPSQIFNYTRNRLITSISKDGQKDGFDGIIIRIDTQTKEIIYSAANNNPVLISNNEVIHLHADKMPVGYGERREDFTQHKVVGNKGDILYLYTDGYADQFGGPKGKKFKYKQLDELLLNNTSLSLNEQKEKLASTFEEWRGDLEQVDDVCVIGIRI